MGLRARVDRLQKAMRGRQDYFELADGSRHYFDPEEAARERFKFFSDSMVADFRREPRPEPPALLRAVSNARDRREALARVMGGYGHLPLDEEALVERGDLVPRSLCSDPDAPYQPISE